MSLLFASWGSVQASELAALSRDRPLPVELFVGARYEVADDLVEVVSELAVFQSIVDANGVWNVGDPSDYRLARRVAYLESHDGADAKSIVAGRHHADAGH